ncbi:MAG: hypothetical protein O7G85_02675 [Planctomycetota bacterium]|nr:hypothetical protein [Planctomycetota bacterium]
MSHIDEAAQLLMAAWMLSEENEGGPKPRIPTEGNILDRALQVSIREGAFPEWFRGILHFTDGSTGLECLELQEILKVAQKRRLTTAPNPSYHATELRISARVARWRLKRLNVSEEDAKGWANILRNAIIQIKGGTPTLVDE